MDYLHEKGAEISYYDPHIPVIKPSREHAHWAGMNSVSWEKSLIEEYDVVLISTDHNSVNYDELYQWSKLIVDTRNVLKGYTNNRDIKIWKA